MAERRGCSSPVPAIVVMLCCLRAYVGGPDAVGGVTGPLPRLAAAIEPLVQRTRAPVDLEPKAGHRRPGSAVGAWHLSPGAERQQAGHGGLFRDLDVVQGALHVVPKAQGVVVLHDVGIVAVAHVPGDPALLGTASRDPMPGAREPTRTISGSAKALSCFPPLLVRSHCLDDPK